MSAEAYRAAVRTAAQAFGDEAEALVAAHLAGLGWSILGRNVRVGRGELDVVAIEPKPLREIVIVEVRWRCGRGYGLAEESIDHRKRAHLRAAIGRLLEDGLPGGVALPALSMRVDLIVVEPGAKPAERPILRHHRAIAL